MLVMHHKILVKIFLIGPLWGELRLFVGVLGLRGMKKFFKKGPKFFVFKIIYDPEKFAYNRFSTIRFINSGRDGFMCKS